MAAAEHLALCARMERNGLVGAECAALTGGRPDGDGVADCVDIDLIGRSAYVQHGLDVLAAAPTFDELVDAVRSLSLETERFRIDVHDPAGRLASTSNSVAIALADVIPAYPDLRDPTNRFTVVVRENEVVLGRVGSTSTASYRLHDAKPWTTSSSLDSRLARGLVNLVSGAASILDPCCGAGSIVVEAAALGLDAHGVDWKPAMVGMTRQNLDHFDYPGSVELADSRTHVRHVDAVVTDLPYGHAIRTDEATVRAILEQAATLAPRAVFVAQVDMTEWLEDAGYTDIEVFTVNKRKGFSRWVHTATSVRAA